MDLFIAFLPGARKQKENNHTFAAIVHLQSCDHPY